MSTLGNKEYFGQENILDAKYVSKCDYVCDGPVEALYFHRFQVTTIPQLKHQLGVHEHILGNDMLGDGYGPENIFKMQGKSAEDVYKIFVGKDDYIARTMTLAELATGGKEQVEKNLKNYQKTTLVPGFRKGKTPMQIIIKKYKKSNKVR